MRKIAILTAASAVAFANPKTAAEPAKTEGAKDAKAPAAPIVVSAVFTLPAQPERKNKRGGTSQFPFDSLTAAGMAFGVKGRDAKSMSQILSNQNRKGQVNKTDSEGNTVYKTKDMQNADGSVTKVPTSEPEKVPGKRFYAFDITAEYAPTLAETPLADYGVGDVLIIREA